MLRKPTTTVDVAKSNHDRGYGSVQGWRLGLELGGKPQPRLVPHFRLPFPLPLPFWPFRPLPWPFFPLPFPFDKYLLQRWATRSSVRLGKLPMNANILDTPSTNVWGNFCFA